METSSVTRQHCQRRCPEGQEAPERLTLGVGCGAKKYLKRTGKASEEDAGGKRVF